MFITKQTTLIQSNTTHVSYNFWLPLPVLHISVCTEAIFREVNTKNHTKEKSSFDFQFA